MRNSGLLLALLLTLSFSLTEGLLAFRVGFDAAGRRSGDALTRLLGDARRVFSYHFFKKADAYFHRGKYPSIFEEKPAEKEDHMTQGTHVKSPESGAAEAHQDEQQTGADEPQDWIARLNRHLKPSQHVHLEGANAREILPWLSFSAELDPHRIETYTVAAYWLRTRLGKVKEAEQFLREGLRQNPNSYEILFELGRLIENSHQDLVHARNVYKLALGHWEDQEAAKPEPDKFTLGEILIQLAHVEEQLGDLPSAISRLERLKSISPYPAAIQKQINDFQSRLKGEKGVGQ